MLWALVSSAYIFYLYRKLKPGAEQPQIALPKLSGDLGTTFDALDRRLASIEARLVERQTKDPVR